MCTRSWVAHSALKTNGSLHTMRKMAKHCGSCMGRQGRILGRYDIKTANLVSVGVFTPAKVVRFITYLDSLSGVAMFCISVSSLTTLPG